MQFLMQHLKNKPGKGSVRPRGQDSCSSELGMIPERDVNTVREMPEDLPALSEAVKVFVRSGVTLTIFLL